MKTSTARRVLGGAVAAQSSPSPLARERPRPVFTCCFWPSAAAISTASTHGRRRDASARGSRADDRDGLQDRRKPSIQLDQEQAIAVREVDTITHLPLQQNQLMSERRILCRK